MQIEVTQEDSFDCCLRLINLGFKPVVLDCASSTNPGGGWRGNQVGTQEESLCRRSNLGILLEKAKYPIPADGVMYIQKVTIEKKLNLDIIDKKLQKSCSVIASELTSISERSQTYLETRINSLYATAIANKHDAIILTA